MPKGIKGFQKGHIVSSETRLKISNALKRRVVAKCYYCHLEFETQPSAFARKKRHFLSPLYRTTFPYNYRLRLYGIMRSIGHQKTTISGGFLSDG